MKRLELSDVLDNTSVTDDKQIQREEVQFNNSCKSTSEGCKFNIECKSPNRKNFQVKQEDKYIEDEVLENDSSTCFDIDTHLLQDLDDSPQPSTKRWSPLGANYEDTMSPELDLELPSLKENLNKNDLSNSTPSDISRLRCMEEEQELLTSSLLALTSHFAHVQLRVRQIVEASPDERDQLLEDLNEFAFQGIPEPKCSDVITNAPKLSFKSDNDGKARQRQCELIEHLKRQLCELEKLAYESGAPVLPQHMLLEKQKIIIDELKNKMNLKIEEHELPQLSSEELIYHVDSALGEFVGPLKMKEQLVAQLKTQITDLERFIYFLQSDSGAKVDTASPFKEKLAEAYNSYSAKKKIAGSGSSENYLSTFQSPSCSKRDFTESRNVKESLNNKTHRLMDKASDLIQMFLITHLSEKDGSGRKNILKKTTKGNHWGDLRAQLEIDIQEVASLASTLAFNRKKPKNRDITMISPKIDRLGDFEVGALSTNRQNHPRFDASTKILRSCAISSNYDEGIYSSYVWQQNEAHYKDDFVNALGRELVTVVRKKFAMTLQRLIQHGLRVETTPTTTNIIVPFLRCFNPLLHEREFEDPPSFEDFDSLKSSFRRDEYEENREISNGFRPMHAWELILEYYYFKNGDVYNNKPARKLSESFNLEITDAKDVCAKQSLLTTVGSIIGMHRPFKRSFDAHFKAFVCAGLNSKQLVEWLHLILSCKNLIERYFIKNSYVMRTGFRDSLGSIGELMKYDFNLPVDLAVRSFQNI